MRHPAALALHHRPAAWLVAFALALASAPAAAVYKVVQPDGSVVYTDRPPVGGSGRIFDLGRPAAPEGAEPVLPPELRAAAQRYPVTLYTSPDCVPCDSGRALLQQRGVPYRERLVTTGDDTAVLERTVGGRTVPSLTVGAQPLRGYAEPEWSAYLDAAGYPRESRLPRNWQPPPPTPLVERAPARTEPRAVAPPRALPPTPTPTPTPDPAPGGIRF